MKKTIYSLALVSALAFASVAGAEELEVRGSVNSGPGSLRVDLRGRSDDDRVGASSTLRAEFEARKAASVAEREARKASSTARRVEVQQSIAKRQMERAGRVLAKTVEHLENILARVESRIAKVKAEGGNTAESESFVAEVKVHLSAAKTDLAAFSSIQITSDKASENFQAVRKAASNVKEDLKSAHESLMKAIRALKPGRDGRNATSTNATSTDQDDN